MATLMLKAHFDGERIRLDEPYELPKDAPLLVAVLPMEDSLQAWREDLYAMAEQSLARAYGDDEPEYTIEDARP